MPGAAQPALDLVEDQRGAVRVARRARGAQDVVAEHVDAALALHGLEQDRGGALVDGRGDRLGRRRDRDEARARAARRAPAWTPAAWPTASRRCARGSRRAARRSSPPGLALRATLSAASLASVPELAKWTLPPSEDSARRCGQPQPGLGVEEVADVDQALGLLADRRDDRAGGSARGSSTARPVRKSRYSLPSSSHSRAPSPRTNSTRQPRVGGDEVRRARAPGGRRGSYARA